eukprot:UN4474
MIEIISRGRLLKAHGARSLPRLRSRRSLLLGLHGLHDLHGSRRLHGLRDLRGLRGLRGLHGLHGLAPRRLLRAHLRDEGAQGLVRLGGELEVLADVLHGLLLHGIVAGLPVRGGADGLHEHPRVCLRDDAVPGSLDCGLGSVQDGGIVLLALDGRCCAVCQLLELFE